jgi:hypothetical protein
VFHSIPIPFVNVHGKQERYADTFAQAKNTPQPTQMQLAFIRAAMKANN